MFLFRRFANRSRASVQGGSSDASDTEDDESNKALHQASQYISEGHYERALLMLEKLGQLYPSIKEVAELFAVAEVLQAADHRCNTCLSKRNGSPDWYKIFKVDESADIETIKKRYRQLALLLHPDKNKHKKAEAAFKLATEAYSCLSDQVKRSDFDAERYLKFCRRCTSLSCSVSGSNRMPPKEGKAECRRPRGFSNRNQSDWITDQEKLKIFQTRARARVLGNLVRVWREMRCDMMEDADVKLNTFSEKMRSKPQKYAPYTNGSYASSFRSSEYTDAEIHKLRKANVNSSSERVCTQGLSKPCQNLEVLIRGLQTELCSHSNKSCQRKNTGEVHLQKVDSTQKRMETLDRASSQNPDEALRERNSNANVQDIFNTRVKVKELSCAGISMEDKFARPVDKRNTSGHFQPRVSSDKDSKLEAKFIPEEGRDSLDIEEILLQAQKEKSEQIFKTLQDLREQTRSVAASLHSIWHNYDSKIEIGAIVS